MAIERDLCSLCGGAMRDVVWEGRGATAGRCGRCGFVVLTRRSADAAGEARSTYERIYREPPAENKLTALSYAAVLRGFEHYRRSGTIVDLGCGSGGFLVAAVRAGWTAIGTESARSAQEIRLPQGASIVPAEESGRLLADSSADVVTLWEVIEHAEDPVSLLSEARRVARPGGLVYVTTPNHGALSRRLLGRRWPRYHIEHTAYFDRKTIHRALALADLRTSRISTRTFDPLIVVRAWRGDADGTRADPCATAPRDDAEREFLRRFAKRTWLGSAILRAVNAVLSITGLGDTLVAQAERPGGPSPFGEAAVVASFTR